LNNKNLDEIGVTGEEIGLVESSFAAFIGICAALDCCSSAFVRLCDAVAALSCEVAKVDKKLFDLTVSGNGFRIRTKLMWLQI